VPRPHSVRLLADALPPDRPKYEMRAQRASSNRLAASACVRQPGAHRL